MFRQGVLKPPGEKGRLSDRLGTEYVRDRAHHGTDNDGRTRALSPLKQVVCDNPFILGEVNRDHGTLQCCFSARREPRDCVAVYRAVGIEKQKTAPAFRPRFDVLPNEMFEELRFADASRTDSVEVPTALVSVHAESGCGVLYTPESNWVARGSHQGSLYPRSFLRGKGVP